jgi:hypothetical protein
MSISEKQRNANRENAKKSTGPKTEEGKRRSALNGSRHNLTGAAYVMSDEDRQAFDKFSAPFIASLNPADGAEHSYAHLVAVAHWRLNRVHAIEENTFSMGHFTKASDVEVDHPELHHALTQARVFDLKGDTFKNLSLYEQRIAREMNRHLKSLFELQDRRKANEREQAREADRTAAKPMARAAGAAPVPTQTTADLTPAEAASKTESAAQAVADIALIPAEVAAKTEFSSSNGFAFSTTQTPSPQTGPGPACPLETPPLDEKLAA